MGHAEVIEPALFADLAQRCGSTVAVSTLAAVAKTESGFETLRIADNTTHRSHTYQSLEEAAKETERLIAHGDSVDIGLMQINSVNLKGLGMTVRDALDSCKSITAAASILTRNYLHAWNAPTEQVALRDAISQYNTGNRVAGYRNGYVRKVEQAARTLPVVDAVVTGEAQGPVSESWNVWAEEQSPEPDPAATKFNVVDIF